MATFIYTWKTWYTQRKSASCSVSFLEILQGEFPQIWQRNNILFYLMTGILLHYYESGSSQQKGYFFSSQHIDCCSQSYPQFLHFTVWTNIYISYPPPPLQKKKTRKVFYVLLIINFGDLLFGRIEILD